MRDQELYPHNGRSPYSSYPGNGRRVFSQDKSSFFGGWGITLGPHMNHVLISDNVSISGFSWQIAGVLDVFPVNQFGIRLNLGYQTLTARGDNCGGNIINCHLVIHYPLASAIFRGLFLQSKTWHPWIGAGGSMFLPLPTQHDLGLSEESFHKLHGAVIIALGVDIDFQKFYIPIQLDFNWINPLIPPKAREGSKSLTILYLGASIGGVFRFK